MVDYILLQTKQVLSYNVEKYYYFNINNIILFFLFFLSQPVIHICIIINDAYVLAPVFSKIPLVPKNMKVLGSKDLS